MAIRVLIIDDSMLFREIIKRGLETNNDIEIIGVATDPYDASEKIVQLNPDVITCDIEMPKMDGIEFVKRLLPQYPVPVIIVSSISERVFDAMDAGAVDFVTKANASSPDAVQQFILLLMAKIKDASKAKVGRIEHKKEVTKPKAVDKSTSFHRMIAIGASTGGTEAIFNVLKQLPEQMPGIVIVQHIPPVFSRMFAERLNNQTHFKAKEIENGDEVLANHVYVAPGDKHVQVKTVQNKIILQLTSDDKVNGHCPSVDVLFYSVAKYIGNKAIGVILTGMGYDGAKGLAMMKRKGAYTIGQDEESSVVYGMPKVAYELGAVTKQAPLEFIGYQITKHMR